MSLILKPGTLVVIQLGPRARNPAHDALLTAQEARHRRVSEAFSLLDNTIAMVIRRLEERALNPGPLKGVEMYSLLYKNEVVTCFRDEFKLLE